MVQVTHHIRKKDYFFLPAEASPNNNKKKRKRKKFCTRCCRTRRTSRIAASLEIDLALHSNLATTTKEHLQYKMKCPPEMQLLLLSLYQVPTIPHPRSIHPIHPMLESLCSFPSGVLGLRPRGQSRLSSITAYLELA
jgi:hypothetical protein